MKSSSIYQRHLKRPLDIALSGLLILLLSPFLALIALAIKLDSRGPIVFQQKRIGKDKSTFTIYKFRTMRSDAPANIPTHQLQNAESFITRPGRILRKTSLDEMPQLFNIFLGDMSFVGPRPALWNQDDLVAERDKYGANAVRPGLTGWAQVNGRDELEIPKKAWFDGEYMKKAGFFFDVKCLLLTAVSVFLSRGIVEGAGKKA